LHDYPTLIPALVLLLTIALFAIVVGGRFYHPVNLSLIMQQVTIIGILGIAQTLVVLTAGVDLSVGAIMVLASIIMGKLAVLLGFPPVAAFAIGIFAGGICGAINGALVTYIRLPPFIVTLGTWNIFFALDLWYSGSMTIRSQDVEAAAPLLQWLGNTLSLGGARITYGVVFLLLLSLLFWHILNRTAWGRHIYAVGDDVEAARLAGIRTNRLLLQVYIVAGAVCGLGAWALIGRIGSISPQAGQLANLDAVTAVVIGGTSLFGGRGSIVGTLFGALIVATCRNGLSLAGVEVLWQDFTVGILIIIAVALDQWIRRVSA
jgi:fructose transport system permease protein